ncbi:hypothetical protein STENM223S_04827 [Streptomyces tendae]
MLPGPGKPGNAVSSAGAWGTTPWGASSTPLPSSGGSVRGGSPGTHETAMAPPTSASRKPMRKPPRLDTGMDTSASRIAATPANTRTCFWNHRLMPRTTSSTPMIRDPAPAVVDIASVR